MDKIKILVAEDVRLIQKIYESGLLQDVFETRIVSNGKNAMKVYSAWNPDIILLDVRMPEMTGYSVLKEIREKNEDNSTTIIMATVLSYEDDIEACINLGIQGYIVKPIKVGEIGEKILKYYRKVNPEKARAALDELREARKREKEIKKERAEKAQKDTADVKNKETEEKTAEDRVQKENSLNREEDS